MNGHEQPTQFLEKDSCIWTKHNNNNSNKNSRVYRCRFFSQFIKNTQQQQQQSVFSFRIVNYIVHKNPRVSIDQVHKKNNVFKLFSC